MCLWGCRDVYDSSGAKIAGSPYRLVSREPELIPEREREPQNEKEKRAFSSPQIGAVSLSYFSTLFSFRGDIVPTGLTELNIEFDLKIKEESGRFCKIIIFFFVLIHEYFN